MIGTIIRTVSLTFGALLFSSVPVHAGFIQQTSLSAGSYTFDPFDVSLGILNSVSYSYQYSYTIRNLSSFAVNATTGSANRLFTGASDQIFHDQTEQLQSLARQKTTTTSLSGDTFISGVSFDVFTNTLISGSWNSTTGCVHRSDGSPGDCEVLAPSGSATLIYNYSDAGLPPIPLPATLSLFGIGLAGLGWSRRNKA